MLPETVDEIGKLRPTIAHILVSNPPLSDYEWDIHALLTKIHQELGVIKTDKLRQQPLAEPKEPEGEQPVLPLEPEIECPTCHGRGTITVGDGSQGICATCHGVGKVKSKTDTSVLQDETKETGATTTVPAPEAETAVAQTKPTRRARRPGKTSAAEVGSGEVETAPATEPAPATETQPAVLEQARAAAAAYNKSSDEPGAIHCSKDTADKLAAINSSQSLTETPPRLLGLMGRDGKLYACTGSLSVEEHTLAWCYQVVEADKYTGPSRDKVALPGHEGVKATYKGKDYVLIGQEIKFLPETAPTEGTAPPRRRGRKSKAQKEAEQKGAPAQPPVTT